MIGGAKRCQARQEAASGAANTAAVVEAVFDEQMTDFRKAFSVCLEAKKYLARY